MILNNHQFAYGIVQWSNSPNHAYLYANASIGGQYNKLSLYQVEGSQKHKKSNLLGTTSFDVPFKCITWDNFKITGIICGGMEDGSLTLWNPDEILQRKTGKNIGLIVHDQPIFQQPITCCQFNTKINNLIAVGSTQVVIADLSKSMKRQQINIFNPGKINPHQGYHITGISWNRGVQSILASVSSNGLVVVWDLNTNSSIFNFQDNSMHQSKNNVSISWNSQIATQIGIAFDDQKKHELQVWDLRNPKGPCITIDKGHTKGICKMDWCVIDPQLIITAGRDRKIFCWSMVQEESIMQIQEKHDILDLKWNKRVPSLFTVTTNKQTKVYSMNENNLNIYAPKWCKPPVSFNFSLSNKMVSFTQSQKQVKVVFQSEQKEQIKEHLQNLKMILESTNKLENKANVSILEEANLLKIISILKNPRDRNILEFLDYDIEAIIKKAEDYTGKKYKIGQANKKQKKNTYAPISGTEAANIFTKLAQNKTSGNYQQHENDQGQWTTIEINQNWDSGKQKIIKQNILVGNYQGAIDTALKCGRMAQGLIIAYSQGNQVFENSMKAFFTQTTDPFIKYILRHLVQKETELMVEKYDLYRWKECLALINSVTDIDRSKYICRLGQRLQNEQQSKQQNSLFCYILSENLPKIVSYYSNKLKKYPYNHVQRQVLSIVSIIKLINIFQANTKIQECDEFDKILLEVAYYAIQNSYPEIAYKLLKYANSKNKIVANLQYKLYNCNQIQDNHPPKCPFKRFVVAAQKKSDKKQAIPSNKFTTTPQPFKQKREPPPPISQTTKSGSTIPHPPPPPPPMFKKQQGQSRTNSYMVTSTKMAHKQEVRQQPIFKQSTIKGQVVMDKPETQVPKQKKMMPPPPKKNVPPPPPPRK